MCISVRPCAAQPRHGVLAARGNGTRAHLDPLSQRVGRLEPLCGVAHELDEHITRKVFRVYLVGFIGDLRLAGAGRKGRGEREAGAEGGEESA